MCSRRSGMVNASIPGARCVCNGVVEVVTRDFRGCLWLFVVKVIVVCCLEVL